MSHYVGLTFHQLINQSISILSRASELLIASYRISHSAYYRFIWRIFLAFLLIGEKHWVFSNKRYEVYAQIKANEAEALFRSRLKKPLPSDSAFSSAPSGHTKSTVSSAETENTDNRLHYIIPMSSSYTQW